MGASEQKTLSSLGQPKSMFLWFAALILIVVLFLPLGFGNSKNIINKNEARWYGQLEKIASNSSANVEVLFLGSSTMYNAIDEQLFESITGQKSLRLALFGDFGTYGDYQLLKRWIDSSKKVPKSIIIWHAFDFWPRPLKQREVILVSSSKLEMLEFYLSRAINHPLSRPTIHFPVEWAASSIKSVLQNNIDVLRHKDDIKKFVSERFDQLKAGREAHNSVLENKRGQRINYWNAQISGLISYQFMPSYANTYWLEKIIELAEKHHIDILWARSPLNELVLRKGVEESLYRYNAELSEYLLSFKSPAMVILSKEQTIFDNSMGNDLYHVNSKGQKYVTEKIAYQFTEYYKSK